MAKKKAGFSVIKSAGMLMPNTKKRNVFIYGSKNEVVSSPEGVKTWGQAVDKVMKNYNDAWQRLAKK